MIQIDSPGLTVGEKFTLQIKSDDWGSSQEYTEQLNYVGHKFKQYLWVTYVTSEAEVQKMGSIFWWTVNLQMIAGINLVNTESKYIRYPMENRAESYS